jgi:TonB-dependent SusC/RagA subfamily outer membrane receptor
MVHLVVQAGNTVYFSKSVNAEVGVNELSFSADKFPAGIGMVTLFDYNEIPRCERLVFFNYNKRLRVTMQFDKEKYAPREKVKVHIRTFDGDSIPVAANLSLSVVNDQLYTFADDKQHNITSWLLAGADLKGKIEEPDFYFKSDEPKAEQALDYLLLTQGWRRYLWDDVLKMKSKASFFAEKIGYVCGRVVNTKTGQPVKAEVIIMELQNRKRTLKVSTGADGKFKFLDADASSPLQLLACADKINPFNLTIEAEQLNQVTGNSNSPMQQHSLIPELIKVQATKAGDNKSKLQVIPENHLVQVGNEVVMGEDIKKLEEVVVVGYGTVKKKDLTGSVMSVKEVEMLPIQNINNSLQGRVSGIAIINSNAMPGSSTQLRIRGAQSISNNNNPLYVIDGVVFDPNIAGYSFPLQDAMLQNIASIDILKDASATSIYGSRAANGVVVITTNGHRTSNKSIKKYFKPKYAGLLITPRQLSVTREFYYPVYDNEVTPEIREDFRSTIYWNPNINTNNAGQATVEFYNSDEITTFRAVAEGIGRNGYVGREEKKYYTQLPFSMAVKFPAYLSFGDTVNMPLFIRNNTSKSISGKLDIQLPQCLFATGTVPESIKIDAESSQTFWIPFFVKSIPGKDSIKVSFKGNKFKDAFLQAIEVQPKGFPTVFSVSGKESEKQFSFTINKAVAGSLKAAFIAYPDVVSDMMSGIESILHEPYGCFEQTSSSTYPNVMVLQYLKETESKDLKVMDRASAFIRTGYKRLISFETSENGFEWFGHAPAHEGLTAYGVMEFTDMKEVYDGVDKQMLKRTLDWILKHRDGQGGFKRSAYALHSWANDAVSNAYIVYALSQAGVDQIDKEYKASLNESFESLDPYRMALLANAAFNYKKNDDGNTLLEKIGEKLRGKSWETVNIDHSVTNSYGKSLQVETASLYALALMKAPQTDWTMISSTLNYLLGARSCGGFGSTQATILALKAIKQYASLTRQTSCAGEIEIVINGVVASNYKYEKDAKGKISIEHLEPFLKNGENKVEIRYIDTKAPLPFSFDATWNAVTPSASNECKVDMKTSLSTKATKVGETVRLNVKLANKTSEGLPMTVAIVGIPSGLSLQPWQLKEITDKHLVDFYEVVKNYLVIYYTQMKPSELHELNFDLKAEIPGDYQAPASSGYLYYTNEYKDWEDGESIRINR